MNLMFSQTAIANCSLDGKFTLYDIKTYQHASWGGFINHECGGVNFKDYLCALGQWVNLTGQIFLDATEQNCLALMKAVRQNVLECRIEKLMRGASGCSVYSVKDVVAPLGDSLRNLKEDFDLGRDQEDSLDHSCRACLARWVEIGKSCVNGTEIAKPDADLYWFAVLITLTGKEFGEKNWVQTVCLGEQSPLPIGKSSMYFANELISKAFYSYA